MKMLHAKRLHYLQENRERRGAEAEEDLRDLPRTRITLVPD